jgi:hypothetical protein
MNATMALEARDGTAFRITAGSSGTEGSDQRHLTFAVPETNDAIRLDWSASADFDGLVDVSVRLGTMPARSVTIKANQIVDDAPPDRPRFGPDADGILSVLAHAFATLVLAHPGAISMLNGRVPKDSGLFGEVPKDLIEEANSEDGLLTNIAQYAAAGAALGIAIAGPDGALPGSVLGAKVGVLVHMGES